MVFIINVTIIMIIIIITFYFYLLLIIEHFNKVREILGISLGIINADSSYSLEHIFSTCDWRNTECIW